MILPWGFCILTKTLENQNALSLRNKSCNGESLGSLGLGGGEQEVNGGDDGSTRGKNTLTKKAIQFGFEVPQVWL